MYKREYLNTISEARNTTEINRVAQELANKIFADVSISLAEEEFACGILKILKNEKGEKDVQIANYKSCKNYNFKTTYLKYFLDLNAHKPKMDYDGEIPESKKRKDVEFLNKEYIDWQNFLQGKLNGSELINYVAQETNYQLKELKKYCDRMQIGIHYRNYVEKSLTLHGKYIFLLAKEFYQELETEQQTIEINGEKILIDAFTYVHTMFRHFASSIKDHQQEKTYHFDENIGFKVIPNTLFDIIQCYKTLPESKSFDNKNINVEIANKPYSIWLRPFSIYGKGNIRLDYFRVQTFYPIDDKSQFASEYKLVESSCGYRFYIKNVT